MKESVGTRLRNLRLKSGLSVQDIVELVGIDIRTLHMIETDSERIYGSAVHRKCVEDLALLYGVDLKYVVCNIV